MRYLPFLLLLPYITDLSPADSTVSYTSIEVGTMSGKYPVACGPDHSFFATGGGVSRTDEYGERRKLTYGAQAFIGEDRNGGSITVGGLYPYIRYDHRWFAVGGGVNLWTSRVKEGNPAGFPGLSIRLGPSDILFLDANFLHHFPGNFGRPFLKLGLGVPFMQGRSSIHAGASDAGWYVNPLISFDSRFTLDPFVAYSDPSLYNFSFTFHYHFR